MSTRKIDAATAEEHLRDGQDNILECVKTVKRVIKSFPDLEPALMVAVAKLDDAKAVLVDVGLSLKKR